MPPSLVANYVTFGRDLDNKMSRIGLMRGRLLVLVLLCHRVDGLLLTTSPAARLPAPVGGDSPLVRPLEGPDFFDACSTAHVAVVLFHGEKCRSCRAFTPKYSRLAQQYQGQAEFFRVVATRNADLLASEHVATLLPWCAEAESSPVPGLGAGPPTPESPLPCAPQRQRLRRRLLRPAALGERRGELDRPAAGGALT